MSTALQPVITKAGLAAIFNATNSGFSAEITHIVVGTGNYTPSNEQKTLRNQVAKYPIAGGEKLTSTLLHLSAVADGASAFWVREIGFLLSDGTLLAVWSHPTEALAYKPAGDQLLLAYDLSLAALPANSVTINTTAAGLNLTLAEPLAAMASALMGEQLRNVLQQDQISELMEVQRIMLARLGHLQTRIEQAEQIHAADHEGLLSMGIAAADSIISTQTQLTKHLYGA
ncbi:MULTISPECIES: phage tail protein [Pseudomonas putida group]|uniref:Phage tail protein n=2 Tax=Pseudomonas putida group TaxID=136845 RepID=A0A2R7UGN4_PSEDL|nr:MULTISPECIES: phage tail protein [Pseudomonas putida group]MBF8705094.1 phage tail protein [Pseudomonas putida]MBF8739367.1 phage tail protein [Pseudomonas putida]PTU51357.1 phage tail protein [Pseudomonas plecoglossicida]